MKLAEHLELDNIFGNTRVLVESFGEEKLMLVFFSRDKITSIIVGQLHQL